MIGTWPNSSHNMTISSDQPSPLPPTSATSVPIAEQHFPVDGSRFLEKIGRWTERPDEFFFTGTIYKTNRFSEIQSELDVEEREREKKNLWNLRIWWCSWQSNEHMSGQIQRQKWIIDYHWCHRNVARIITNYYRFGKKTCWQWLVPILDMGTKHVWLFEYFPTLRSSYKKTSLNW